MKKNVLIIGSGGAGLVAALYAKENGANVKILTKEYPTRSQTCMAQGGINAAFGNVGDDSVDSHIQDTLKSAHSLADEKSINFLCSQAKDAVSWLDSIGVCFSRTVNSKIAQRKLGGASSARACYAQDYTGLKILHTLYDRCLSQNIEILSEKYLLDIDTTNNTVSGVSVLDIPSGDVEYYEASSVVLATGGYAGIYTNYSTNSSASTGDGIAVALRAKANVKHMEFIQFHPTALKTSSILISESARGAGGYILNSKGQRFTNELAPRDEVARAIYEQIQNGEDIFLDIRHLGEEFINEELPQERKLAKLYENIDPVDETIPIKPAPHYTMGGLEVDENTQTNISGLFAVGECANHNVHGANRLGGNSLLELIVFGKVAGENAATFENNIIHNHTKTDMLEQIATFSKELDFYASKHLLSDIFYEKVGIFRDENSLQTALDSVLEIKQNIVKMGVTDNSKVYNTNLVEFLEFINMVELAEVIINSALERKESVGAHFRTDCLD